MQALPTNICSNALTVETQDLFGQRTPVTTNTQVTFTASGGGSASGVSFFTDPQCLNAPNGTVQIPTGQATASIYFRASQAGAPVITANSFSLASAMQTQNVISPPNQLVFVTNPPAAPILAGQCFLATVESRSNGVVANVLTNSTVSLQASPSASLRFFSNSTCTTSTTSVQIPTGTSRANFYVKAISGGPDTVIASAPFGTAQLLFTVQGVVRRGVCSMASTQATVICPVSPPQQVMARTMLMYQGVTSADQSGPNSVKCRLATLDTISCERPAAGSPATIQWQTAELPSGLNVQRSFSPACLPSVPLTTPVNPASSFVLSSFSGVGENFDGDDLSAAVLVSDGGVVLIDNRDPMSCTGFEFQVVELSGITALRGSTPGMQIGQRTASVPFLPAASPNAVVFNQTLLSAAIPINTPICPLLVRSEIDTPTSLLFSRAAGSINNNCTAVPLAEMTWERVDFGSRGRVQTFLVDLQNNTQDVPIGQVDMTRTLVFSGGQAVGGQASGETDYNNQGSGAVGVATARFELYSSNNVRVVRGRSTADATIMMYVVELEP